MQHHRSIASLLALAATLATTLVSGCELTEMFDDLDNPRTLVNVAVTHHATAMAGGFPDLGAAGENRSFVTDDGWSILLVRAYFTTASIALVECEGAEVPVDLYWGPLAEDIRAQDLGMLTLGGVKVEANEFCAMNVHYGPYPEGAVMDGLDPRIAGAVFYLEGSATKGDVVVPFEIRSDRSFDAVVDMSTIEGGGPLTVHGGEDFPVELALSKTYDRLFDGVDFESATTEDLENQVGAALTLESRVSLDRVAP